MRVASLLPSATEIVYALGLGDQLVAVTHECDYPPAASTHRTVTRDLLPPAARSSSAIDVAVRASVRDAHTVYALDAQALIETAPDVVLTQSLCEVCAVPRSAVEEVVCEMPRGAAIVSLDPHTIDEMLDSILLAAKALDVAARGREVVDRLRTRIDVVQRATSAVARRPRVLCCEWLDPVYCAGHWVPEQVRIAGGEDIAGTPGAPARVIAREDVACLDADVVLLMPCGFDAQQTAERAGEFQSPTTTSHIFSLNGSAYFSRPGPRLVDGIELLASILHPGLGTPPAPEGAALRLSFNSPGRVISAEPYR